MGLICCCSLPPSACKTCPNYLGYFGSPMPTATQPYVPVYNIQVHPTPDYTEEVRKLRKEIEELKKLLEEKS